MIRKVLLLIVTLVLTSVMMGQTAHAEGEKYYWNGNEGLMVRGGKFNEQRAYALDGEAVLRQSGALLNLKKTSVNGAAYQTIGDLGIIYSKNLDLGFDADCAVRKLSVYTEYVNEPKKNDKVTKIYIDDTSSVSEGATGTVLNWWNDTFDKCKYGLNGETGIAAGEAGDPHDISTGEILGTRGESVTNYLFKSQIDKMYERERTRFQQKMCGIRPGGDVTAEQLGSNISQYNNCGKPVREAYAKIWDLCRTQALALSISDSAVGSTAASTDGKSIADSMSSCIKDYTGIDIDSDVLSYNSTTEIVNDDNPESCSVPYIGWIICPLSRFMSVLVDNAFEAFQEFFVITPLDTGSEAGKILYTSWGVMRNFANVIFAIFFLVIILSQVSSFGISNYGIKKLLPRLIVTAILVNISYHLCVIAIDISNVLGGSLKDLLELLKPTVEKPLESWASVTEGIIVYSVAATGIGLVLLTGSLVALFPLLVGAALSVALAILIILARLAILLALTMIAPLALVCFLLPNTKQWFDKWLGLFTAMLLVYPVISVVYGLSTVASLVVLNSSLANPGGSITLQLFALAIQVIPLAITPLLLKLGGGVLGRVGGIAEGSRLFAKTRGRADDFAQRKKNARDTKALQNVGSNRRGGLPGLRDRVIQRKYLRKAKHQFNKEALDKTNASYISGYVSGEAGYGGDKAAKPRERAQQIYNDLRGREFTPSQTRGEKFAEKLAVGGNTSAVLANAINMQHTFHSEDVKARKLELRNLSPDKLEDLAVGPNSSQNEAIRQAAVELMLESGLPNNVNKVVKASGGMTDRQRRVVADKVSGGSIAGGSPYYGGAAVRDNILKGEVTADNFGTTVVAAGLTKGVVTGTSADGRDIKQTFSNVSDTGIGVASGTHLDEIHGAIQRGDITNQQLIDDIRNAARNGQSTEARSGGDTDNMDALRRLSNGG